MLKRIIVMLIIILPFISCIKDESDDVPQPVQALYVVNSLAETISVIDLETGEVFNDVFLTGITPAEIKYHDDYLYIVNSGDNTLQRIQGGGAWTEFIELGPYRNPAFMEFIGGDSLAILNFQSGTMTLVDYQQGVVLDEIPVGLGPWGMTYHEGKIYIGVSNLDMVSFVYGQGRVAKINAATFTLEDSLDVGVNPGILFVDSQGELNVICIGDYWSSFGEIWRVNLTSFEPIGSPQFVGGSPGYEAVDAEGNVYLGAGGWSGEGAVVLKYNCISEQIINDAENPILLQDEIGASGLTVDSEGNVYVCCLYSDHIVKINPEGEILETFPLPDGWGPERVLLLDTRIDVEEF
ncbi:hypothetical protein ISS30_00680 [bacterium]|nr:hypothetical protein [FCB group bacterium]MBL7190186.1 hypothetical protein [bacterium]